MRIAGLALLLPLLAVAETTPAEKAWGVLWDGLQSKNPQQRIEAMAALTLLGPDSTAVAYIENELENDSEAAVRKSAAGLLGEMKSVHSIPKLRNALRDPDPRVVFAASRALWDLGDRSARDLLIQVAQGERSDNPGLVKGAMEDTRKRLASPSSLMMLGIKEGAGAFLGPFSMGILVAQELMKDGSAQARVLAISALADDPDPRSERIVEDALTDRSPAVRIAAAKGLAQRHAEEAIPRLEIRLSDESSGARFMAAAALLKLAGSPARAPQ